MGINKPIILGVKPKIPQRDAALTTLWHSRHYIGRIPPPTSRHRLPYRKNTRVK